MQDFPELGGQTQGVMPIYYLAIYFSRKLHEIQRNWSERGMRPSCPLGSVNEWERRKKSQFKKS